MHGELAQLATTMAPTASTDAPVAQALVNNLVERGVDTFFGIPGGPIISMFHQVLLHAGARLIESRQESGGIFAAMGYFRATGKTPAMLVTAGPGITNAMTGMAAAAAEGVPIIIVCGDVASDGRRLLQDLGAREGSIEAMLGGIARAVHRVVRPDAAVGQLSAALETALHPQRPGPVALVVPVDVADKPTRAPALAPIASVATHERPDARLCSQVATRLADARLPLVVVGHGCRGDSAKVRRLIDALGVPFLTTPQAKGLVDEGHPLSLRNGGMSASHWARRYTSQEPDVALVLGSDVDDVSTAGTPVVGPEGRVIHVDTDATVFARNFPTELGIPCPIASFCTAMLQAVSHWPQPRDGLALASDAKSRSPFDSPAFETDPQLMIAPHRVLADLEAAARPGDRFVSDIGEHMLFALHYLTARSPDRFHIHLGLGSMGSGIGSSIGLALGQNKGRVICICGDGGMQMNGAEILVAREHQLPVVFAVFNDARYNMVYHGYRLTHERTAPWSTGRVDFVAWARAHGVDGRLIERPGEITKELLDEVSQDGPVILDIRHDPAVRIRGDGRIEALRQMSFGETAPGGPS